ncbi:SGNH/GDSL hydrolase family protein [Vibrio parahaemolyticus]|uniref:SGNH/GDSL hydrolase family protein n=1 Tax=Vibrio parahaemolyticus TaxID=670 RepID=UPI001D539F8F|nr:SGNH/GDSL hydrolase family protein [Vibrio parahaemolyticus]EGR3402337.1 G-D-S-L family lipolytic protein [Vibrio parahaemolyticus]EGS6761205.1 SGNH/GDSL hydrolase family protein [Vibrio parahaemolyticus]EGY8741218.1 SGNH/GDSL hydrolase family protein [Vibrio parahaemolyticus]EHE6932268.1 SGNH/GDSL hydrolase family protein [Vibrio parahaemolyticus]EHE6936762.1 SGNH/GDSL hydrolase family protein [Vibrio parahaemolyticus]
MKALTHEEAVEEVYRLTPQIKEYDNFMYLGVRWLPYTMYFHLTDYVSNVINTDAFGFRYSYYKGQRISVAELPENTTINILVGGSTVLATGATRDEYTTASALSKISDEAWINFGGRGFNATQELIMFLMHQHRFNDIGKVVIFSGMNTLTLEGLPDEHATEHGRYYYSYEYNHYMNIYNDDLKVRQNTYGNELDKRNSGVFGKLKSYFNPTEDSNPADIVITDEASETSERLKRAAWYCANAAHQWKQLLAGFNADIYFFLQPLSSWTRDYLVEEEKQIFHAIDSCPNNFWRLFSKILDAQNHGPFVDHLSTMLQEHEIPFFDMNELLKTSKLLDSYLFVDRVHFNDVGYEEVGRLIYENL